MNPSQRWIETQKAMPSFVAQRGEVASALDAPIPSHLQGVISGSPGGGGGAGSPRTPGTAQRQSKGRSMTPPASTGRGGAASRSLGGGASSPRRAIHEELLEKGRLYQEVKEARREKSLMKEQRRCRSVPRISKMGHNIERNEDIVKRLYRVEDEKKQMSKYKMMEVDMKEKKVMDSFFTPQLSRRGARAQGKTMASQQNHWDYKRKERLEELRRTRIMEEMNGVQEGPDLNPRSEKLATQRREREGLAGYSHAECLLERDRLSKLAKWELQQRDLLKDNPGNPRITEYAAMLERDGDIGERLMREGSARKERQAMRQRESSAADASGRSPHINHTPNARQQQQNADGSYSLTSPGMVTSPSAGNGNQFVTMNGDDILDRHNEYYKKRDDKIKQVIEMEKKMHVPAINPVSDQIAARLPQSAMERLTSGTSTPRRSRAGTSQSGVGASSPAAAKNPYEYASANNSPQRQANTPPRTAGGGNHSGKSPTPSKQQHGNVTYDDLKAYERMRLAEERKQLRIQKVKEELEEKEKEECTFAPQTNTSMTPKRRGVPIGGSPSSASSPAATAPPSGAYASPNNSVHGGGASPSSMHDRAAMWQRKRDEKIAKMRQEQEREEADQPFAPTITGAAGGARGDRGHTTGGSAADQHDAGIYGGSGRAWGYDEYVDRLEEARIRKEERAKLAERGGFAGNAAGTGAAGGNSNYNPEKLTKPVGPKLGVQRDREDPNHLNNLNSLHRPVAAPYHGDVSGEASNSNHTPGGRGTRPNNFNNSPITPGGSYPTPPSHNRGGYPQAPNATPAAGVPPPGSNTGVTPDPRNLAALLMGASPYVQGGGTPSNNGGGQLHPDEFGGGGNGGGVNLTWEGLEDELDDDEYDHI